MSVTAELRCPLGTEHHGKPMAALVAERAAAGERGRQIKELAAQAPPNSKLGVGDWPLRA